MKVKELLIENNGYPEDVSGLLAILRPTIRKLLDTHYAHNETGLGQQMRAMAGFLAHAVEHPEDVEFPEELRDVVNLLNHHLQNINQFTPEKVDEIYHRLQHAFDPHSEIRQPRM